MGRRFFSAGKGISRYFCFNVKLFCLNYVLSFLFDEILKPGVEAGDVVIILQLKPHDLFKRQGDDLYMSHTISLTEALCGFCYVLKVT